MPTDRWSRRGGDKYLRPLAGRPFSPPAVVIDEQAVMFPVNSALDREAIGAPADRVHTVVGAEPARIAVEADGVDAGSDKGWTATVQGTRRYITDAISLTSPRVLAEPQARWMPAAKTRGSGSPSIRTPDGARPIINRCVPVGLS